MREHFVIMRGLLNYTTVSVIDFVNFKLFTFL